MGRTRASYSVSSSVCARLEVRRFFQRAQHARARVHVVARLVLRERQLVQRVGLVDRTERDDRRALSHDRLLVARRVREFGEPLVHRHIERIHEHRSIERVGRAPRVAERLEEIRELQERLRVRFRQRRPLDQHVGLLALVALLLVCRREQRVRTVVAAILGEHRPRLLEQRNRFVDLVCARAVAIPANSCTPKSFGAAFAACCKSATDVAPRDRRRLLRDRTPDAPAKRVLK